MYFNEYPKKCHSYIKKSQAYLGFDRIWSQLIDHYSKQSLPAGSPAGTFSVLTGGRSALVEDSVVCDGVIVVGGSVFWVGGGGAFFKIDFPGCLGTFCGLSKKSSGSL